MGINGALSEALELVPCVLGIQTGGIAGFKPRWQVLAGILGDLLQLNPEDIAQLLEKLL
jgi:hypothetical protein